MKKLFTFFTIILFVSEVFAQSPQKMSYQAVIRNSDDALVANTEVGMQISILQGSVFGASVYVETQTPTTSVNGLVSVEIGSEDATILYGSLSEVDWSDGPYFIKTETDPAGGTNYSISGVSQLLSVPYALHAKTAETVTGGVSETDPVFSESEAANITASVITKLDSLSGTNTGDQDLSALATKTALSDSITQVRSEISNVGGGVTQAALVDTAANLRNELATKTALGDSTAQVRSEIPDVSGFASQTALVDTAADLRSALATKTALSDSIANLRSEGEYTAGKGISISNDVISVAEDSLSVGDSYQGGIIFWLDASGEHGLIVSNTDQATDSIWADVTNKYVGASGDGLYSGEMNTAMIVAGLIADAPAGSSFAAKVCADYSVTADGVTYGDWYLPSINELSLLFSKRSEVGGLSDTYWSSCEYDDAQAYATDFSTGMTTAKNKDATANVRAIRAF